MQKDQKNKKEWKSIVELFEAMNESLDYCVLRNAEDITRDFSSEIHGDIDILVADREKAKQVLRLKKVYSESYRTIYEAIVAGKSLRIDIKYVGDNYYCEKWEIALLKSSHKILHDNIHIKVPSLKCLYYSLLYHAYLQKNIIANDYPSKLLKYADGAGLLYKNDASYLIAQLEEYMKENDFKYVFPNDINMPINWQNLRYFTNYKKIRFWEWYRPNIVFFRFNRIIAKIIKKAKKYLRIN